MNRKGLAAKAVALAVSAAILLSTANPDAYAGEDGTRVELTTGTQPGSPGGDDPVIAHLGYIKPENPYTFKDDAVILRGDGPEGTYPEAYMTSEPGFRSGEAVPGIAECLKAGSQGDYGLCWVFSVNKAIEAALWKKGVEANLSELNTGYYYWNKLEEKDDASEGHALLNAYNRIRSYPDELEGKQWYYTGGNDLFLDGYLTAWKGVVPESGEEGLMDLTGTPSDDSAGNVFTGKIGRVQGIRHVLATDRDAIKSLIMECGAVTCGMAVDFKDTAEGSHSWYTKMTEPNHQVAIIGWDDNYSKENFKGKSGAPEKEGAWYCVNSWGTSKDRYVDKNGCFWMSYECAFLNDDAVMTAYDVAVPGKEGYYDHNYVGGNAGSPMVEVGDTLVDEGTKDAHGICYAAEGTETVEAVGFTTYETDTDWTIRAYKGSFNDKELVSEQEASFPLPGFHTVSLNRSFGVRKGEKFYVEAEPSAPASMEYVLPGINHSSMTLLSSDGRFNVCSHSGDKYGQSYIGGKEAPQKQVVIHAYTSDAGAEASETVLNAASSWVSATYGDEPLSFDECFTFIPGSDGRGGYDSLKSVSSNDLGIAFINDEDKTLEFAGNGEAKVTVESEWGKEISFNVTVRKASIKTASVIGLKAEYTCSSDRLPLRPSFVVAMGRKRLTKRKDYVCSYSGNDKAGTAVVTIKGTGNYMDSAVREFKIALKESEPEEEKEPEKPDPETPDPEPSPQESDNPSPKQEEAKTPVYGISYKEKIKIEIGTPEALTTSADPDVTKTVKKTRYKTSDKKIAKVTRKGTVKGGKKSGEAVITKQVQILTVTRTHYTDKKGREKVKKKKKKAWADAGSVIVVNEGKY